MTLKEHKKHSTINRPGYGNFGRQEWAIVGTACHAIKTLADNVINALAPVYKCGYVDAQHSHETEETALPGRLASGAVAEYTDQIHYHQFDFNKALNPFVFRNLFADLDVVLVNGNHQQAKAQVIVLDETKKASLQKRISQLTNVQLILLAENVTEVFGFIQEAVPDWQQIPVYRLNETEKIISFFTAQMQQAVPSLNGLVLAGGKSIRMGQDKSSMGWHGKEQKYHVADLLQEFCSGVYISCQPEQQEDVTAGYQLLPDTFTGLGPYGAILSAFREHPDTAWLVVACDLPLLDKQTLQFLVENRNSATLATAFESPQDGLPEPLITVWEPKSYPALLGFLAQGYTCPRKVLRNSTIHSIIPPQPHALLNVNTPEEAQKATKLLLQKSTGTNATS